MASERWSFGFVANVNGRSGEWIDLRIFRIGRNGESISYPARIKVRYSEKNELLCAGLHIGEDAGGWRDDVKRTIPRRMLSTLPLGAILQSIQDRDENDPDLRGVSLGAPAEGRAVVPGAKRKDAFYIQQAELFNEIYVQRRRSRSRGSADVYRRLAERTGWAESTVRAQVRRGWKLRPDLKPEGVRVRRTGPKEGGKR